VPGPVRLGRPRAGLGPLVGAIVAVGEVSEVLAPDAGLCPKAHVDPRPGS